MILCSLSDDATYRISVGGVICAFEFSERFGPFALSRTGEVSRRQPGRAFLGAVTAWCQQGKRIDGDGMCIWSDVAPYDSHPQRSQPS